VLILSVGMPRAGSGWHYNLVHDLNVAGGGKDARQVRQQYRLGGLLTEVNCNLGTLGAHRLLPVWLASLAAGRFAIKLHAGPRPLARMLIRVGQIRATYIYRDPRAALLSAYEYGQRGGSVFKQLKSIKQAIEFTLPYLRIWEAWTEMESVLAVRYEDMLADFGEESRRLLEFLNIETSPGVQAILDKYRPGKTSSADKGLHFHKGQPERFRDALSPEQLAAANQALGDHLERMGYRL